jgi:hypothetical protein
MVLSVATKVFMPEIELANRYGSLARVERRHLIELSSQAWRASCRVRETLTGRNLALVAPWCWDCGAGGARNWPAVPSRAVSGTKWRGFDYGTAVQQTQVKRCCFGNPGSMPRNFVLKRKA